MATLEQLLHNQVVVDVISNIKTPMDRMQTFYRMGIGGANTTSLPGREFSYDIFDVTRDIAQGRSPNAGPANIKRQPIGAVTGMCYRTHEKVGIYLDRVYRNRPLGGQYGQVDSNGANYITRQETTLAQRFKNSREFIVNECLWSNGFGILIDGDDHIPVLKGSGSFDVDFRIPAINIGTIGGIFGADWQTVATATILEDMLALNAQSEEDTGYPIRHGWIDNVVAGFILDNDRLQATGGSANVVFDRFTPQPGTSAEGIGDTGFTFVMRAMPWFTFHINDAGLNVNGTFDKFAKANKMLVTPDPDPNWLEMLEGTEVQRRTVVAPTEQMTGFGTWTTPAIDPPREDLKAVDNAMPALRIPKSVYVATVSA